MSAPEISCTTRPVSPDDIAAVEARFTCKLPEAYVRFLLRNNGGRPKPNAFSGTRPEDEALVHFFFAIDGNEHTDLIENAAMFRSDYHGVPGDLLPIAATTSGDLVCIGIGANNHGEVHFWSHDHPIREEATWKLAPDFDAFLETFHRIDV
jgi:hypothetical protein